MKTAISIPDDLFRAAEEASQKLGLSRSELYQRAIAEYLERHFDAIVCVALERVYGGDEPGRMDPVLDRMQRASLPKEDS